MKQLIYLFVMAFMLGSCGNISGPDAKDVPGDDDISQSKEELSKSTRSIFYNMFLPCEMVYIFEESDASYNPQLINDIERADNYTSNSKKALNVGVYGVDLGYIKLHNELSELKRYTFTINKMSDELGIPSEHVTYAMDYFERNVNSIDSLYQMTCELFEITDSYLNKNQRQSTSSLIILGGWIEALYITANMMGKEVNTDIINRIGRQKYSLSSILSLLTMYEDNSMITNYVVLLNQLKRDFEAVEIYFEDMDDISIDTINKRIYTDNSTVELSVENFIKIRHTINSIRNNIVE